MRPLSSRVQPVAAAEPSLNEASLDEARLWKGIYTDRMRMALDLRRHAADLMESLSSEARADVELRLLPQLEARIGQLRVSRCLWALRAMVLEIDGDLEALSLPRSIARDQDLRY